MPLSLNIVAAAFGIFVTAAPLAAAQPKDEAIGIRHWGYQLQHVKPASLATVPYDAIVIDYARDGSDQTALTPAEVEALKVKPDGTRRVVLAYMSIGEAESYRYYWRSWWNDAWILPNVVTRPSWRGNANGNWSGNYAVQFWQPGWQDIIVGREGYLDRILKAGFDGVWLDKVDSSLEDVAASRPTAKADMIAFIRRIAEKGRAGRPGFLVFPQNGEALLSDPAYRKLIDGFGKEDLLYGEDEPGQRNGAASIARHVALIKQLVDDGKPVLAVEYLDDRATIDAARRELAGHGFAPHFADRLLTSMRIGDHPQTQVATRERAPRKTRTREPTTYDIWKTRVLVAAAGIILLLGLMRRQRSY